MKVRFVDNDGGGFSKEIEIRDGMTADAFFEQQKPGADPNHFKIRVNRQPATQSQVLQDGDSVVVTPTKIEGA